MKRIAFLDRDGVVLKNLSNSYPISSREVTELEFCNGAVDAIRELKALFDEVIIVSNQPDISRGLLEESVLELQNKFILENSLVDAIYICRHENSDKCYCRKPRTGLLSLAVSGKVINRSESIMVGDRWSDIKAGNSFGLTCFFIDYGYPELTPDPPFTRVHDLVEVAKLIRGEQERRF